MKLIKGFMRGSKFLQGFTLLELLIAFTLSMVVLLALIQLMTYEKIEYARQQQLLDVQETAQAATLIFHEVFNEMRSSLNSQCRPVRWLNHTDKYFLHLLPNGNQWAIQKDQKNKVRLIFQHWNMPLEPLLEPMINLRELRIKNSNISIKKNTPMVITDCESAEVATVATVHHGKKNTIVILKQSLSRSYGKNDKQNWITPLLQDTYYVDDTHRYNRAGQSIYGLYVKNISNNVHELIAGILDMHVYKQGEETLQIQMNIVSLEAIKNIKSFPATKKFPLWMEEGRLRLLWNIVLRKKYV